MKFLSKPTFPEEISLAKKKVEKDLLQAKLDLITQESRVSVLEKQLRCLFNYTHPAGFSSGEIDNEKPDPYYANLSKRAFPSK